MNKPIVKTDDGDRSIHTESLEEAMHYEVCTDDNYDKQGNSQAYIGAYDSLEEAVQLCEKIVSQSVRGCAVPGKPAQKVFLSWCFGGTSAFIRGNDAFSAEDYARRLAFSSYSSRVSAFHQEALTLEVYRDQVMGMLEEVLLDFRKNPFDGSALIATLLSDYMIPTVSAYFAELD